MSFVESDPWIGQLTGDRQRSPDRYRIIDCLGQGGMGAVYRARDMVVGRQVALKMLKSNLVGQPELRKRFEREVAISAALESDYIVKVSDYGITTDGFPFYVMEYLRGKSLAQLLRQEERLSEERSIRIMLQICAGLRVAHQGVTIWREGATQGEFVRVVHRDLKPDNIFLVPHDLLGEQVKLLDFGIAKMRHDGMTQTNLTSGLFLGSCRYASPEQWEVDENIDQRADIYSLGVILYEMLSGTDPFGLLIENRGNNLTSWLSAHAITPPRELRSLPNCQHLSEALDRIVLQCLQKVPADRFASVEDLSQALRSAVDLGGVGISTDYNLEARQSQSSPPPPSVPLPSTLRENLISDRDSPAPSPSGSIHTPHDRSEPSIPSMPASHQDPTRPRAGDTVSFTVPQHPTRPQPHVPPTTPPSQITYTTKHSSPPFPAQSKTHSKSQDQSSTPGSAPPLHSSTLPYEDLSERSLTSPSQRDQIQTQAIPSSGRFGFSGSKTQVSSSGKVPARSPLDIHRPEPPTRRSWALWIGGVAALLLIGGLGLGIPQIQRHREQQYLQQAKQVAEQGDLEEAIELATQISQHQSTFAEAQSLIGNWQLQQALSAVQEEDFDTARQSIALIPTDHPAYAQGQEVINTITTLVSVQDQIDRGEFRAGLEQLYQIKANSPLADLAQDRACEGLATSLDQQYRILVNRSEAGEVTETPLFAAFTFDQCSRSQLDLNAEILRLQNRSDESLKVLTLVLSGFIWQDLPQTAQSDLNEIRVRFLEKGQLVAEAILPDPILLDGGEAQVEQALDSIQMVNSQRSSQASPQSLIPSSSSSQFDITGIYNVTGRDPDGNEYKTTLSISKLGWIYRLIWQLENPVQGVGILQDQTLSVGWGGQTCTVVSYLDYSPR